MVNKLASLFGIVIVLLALSGAAEAAIASSGGGLASSISGSGIVQSATGTSAGHSAIVSRNAHVDLIGIGTVSDSESGTDAAIDPVNGASVSVSGITSAAVTIRGTHPFSLSHGLADALIQASSDQDEGGEAVGTLISSYIDLFASNGDVVKGKAVATGKASAGRSQTRGTIPLSPLTASASGTASVSGSVTGSDSLASHLAAGATLQGIAWGADDNSDGNTYAVIGSSADMGGYFGTMVPSGPGSGSAAVSASGAVTAESRWSGGRETSMASGSSSGTYSGTFSFDFLDLYDNGIHSGSSLVSGQYFDGAYIVGHYQMGGNRDVDKGSSAFSASGTVHDIRTDETGTFDGFSNGKVTGTVAHSGAGYNSGAGYLQAQQEALFIVIPPYAVTYGMGVHYNEFILSADEEEISNYAICDGAGILNGITSSLGTWAGAGSDSDAFRATTNLQSTGTVITTGSLPNIGGFSKVTATAKGTSLTGISAQGNGWSSADSSIRATASTNAGYLEFGGGSGPIGVGDVPHVVLTCDPHAVTMSCMDALIKSIISPSYTAMTSATGDAGATASSWPVVDSAGNRGLSVSSSATAAGTVSGKVKGGGKAATGSMILGLGIAGNEIDNRASDERLVDAVMTDTTVLTSAAVSNPGTGTTTAGGKADGIARSWAGEDYISQGTDEEGNALSDDVWIDSSSSGQLTADISAKNGYGNSIAYVRSGGLGGQLTTDEYPYQETGEFIVQSDYPDDFYSGIHTGAQGAGNGPGSRVSGSASATKAVSDETGVYTRYGPEGPWEDIRFRISTANHLTDPARSEFSTRDAFSAGASTDAWAFSQAEFDTEGETGPCYYGDAWGGYAVDAYGTYKALGTTAKAVVKPVDLSSSVNNWWGSTGTYISVRMKGGDGLASIQTQVPAADAHDLVVFTSPAVTGNYNTVSAGKETSTDSNPDYALAYQSLAV